MKIVVGIRGDATVSSLGELFQAGAGEFFCGYVPPYWSEEFGFELSPNRRYFSEAQITDVQHLATLADEIHAHKGQLAVTFNEQISTDRTWVLGRRLISEARTAGVDAVVVADPMLVPEVRREFPELRLHISGDAGVYNRSAAGELLEQGATRVIFPRELSVTDLSAIITETRGDGREFEAFVMGEPCVFDGARCFTEHGYGFSCDFCNDHQVKRVVARKGGDSQELTPRQEPLLRSARVKKTWGLGKCGLCALPLLKSAGITHVKVPGRASHAVTAVTLVSRMIARLDDGTDAAREILETPELCQEGIFCYFPEMS